MLGSVFRSKVKWWRQSSYFYVQSEPSKCNIYYTNFHLNLYNSEKFPVAWMNLGIAQVSLGKMKVCKIEV